MALIDYDLIEQYADNATKFINDRFANAGYATAPDYAQKLKQVYAGVNNVSQALDHNLMELQESVIFGNALVSKTTEGGGLSLVVSAGIKIRLAVFYGFGVLNKAHDTNTIIGKIDSYLAPFLDIAIIAIDSVTGEIIKFTLKNNGDVVLHPHESFGNNIILVSTTYVTPTYVSRKIDEEGNFITD